MHIMGMGSFRVCIPCKEVCPQPMGVSVCEWRFSIGIFNLKSAAKFGKPNMKSHPFMWSCNLFDYFALLLKISLGLLKVFAFCGMVSFMFILLTLDPFLILFFDITFGFGSYHICPFTNYFLETFSLTTLIPCYISAVTQSIFSFFKNHFSVKAKNISFFVCVLKCSYFYLERSNTIRPPNV